MFERAKHKAPDSFPSGALVFSSVEAAYFFEGGTSVHDPCATSAAIPMLSPSVGCGWMVLPMSTACLSQMGLEPDRQNDHP